MFLWYIEWGGFTLPSVHACTDSTETPSWTVHTHPTLTCMYYCIHTNQPILILLLSVRPEQKSWFRRKVYDWDPHFKFPNRMIGTCIISLIGLYTVSQHSLHIVYWFFYLKLNANVFVRLQLTLADYSLSDYTFDKLDALIDSLAEIALSCNETNNLFKSLIPTMNEFSLVARSKI